ncbi:hypothetical protein MUN89_04240 [Halobacillus salinarum]|uniref:DUF983 domain-containing protein n=1 Tax=Halobacillus salinarum TaxID=2932257 RepID=A0ABY4EME6_9BACI|nr:hypothetical protein [Halobacillus salinarum]UOQ45170.1 hypothetical protein MUN89_04240 [Halobacillus salinarum]
MQEGVYCRRCSRQIKTKDNLVVAGVLFVMVPYHKECFAKELRGPAVLFINNQPINSWVGNLLTLLGLLLFAGVLLFVEGLAKWLSLLFLLPVIYRLLAYYLFERRLSGKYNTDNY